MKIKLSIEVEMQDSFDMEEVTKDWLENFVLVGDGTLSLYSNEIGDMVGIIKSVKKIKYLGKSINNVKLKNELPCGKAQNIA